MGGDELQCYPPGSWVTLLSNTSANDWILHCSWSELYSHTEEAPYALSLSLVQYELQA